MQTNGTEEHPEWKTYQKVLFRILFIYFVLQVIPLDLKFYQSVFSAKWFEFQHLFQLTAYYPDFLNTGEPGSALAGFASWGVILVAALVGGLIWSYFGREAKNYNYLYYWLRVLLRYRLSIALIGYGFIKLFPIQIPGPTLSDLNTPYGDFLAWKVYYLTNGAAQASYLQVLGGFELAAALLLFFRKTATFGAAIAVAVLTNIAIANFAYGIGDHVYSTYLLVIALFLFTYDLPRLINLLSRFQFTNANKFRVHLPGKILKARTILRVIFAAFLLVYAQRVYTSYHKENKWTFPATPGLSGAEGYYLVTKHQLNDSAHPYSLVNPERWQNVVFEKWNTLSIRKAGAVPVNFAPARSIFFTQEDNYSYESIGNGGRHFYTYTEDSVNQSLHLYNKQLPGDSLTLAYQRPNDSTIVLSGKYKTNDSLSVELKRLNKIYLLKEGRRNPKRRF